MTDFIPQSTDQLAGTTNPYQGVVVAKGTGTISMTAQATGYAGSLTIPIPIDANISLLKPEVTILNWNHGGGSFDNYPLPFLDVNTSGGINRSGSMRVAIAAKPTAYSLVITIYDSLTQQTNLSLRYKILAIG